MTPAGQEGTRRTATIPAACQPAACRAADFARNLRAQIEPIVEEPRLDRLSRIAAWWEQAYRERLAQERERADTLWRHLGRLTDAVRSDLTGKRLRRRGDRQRIRAELRAILAEVEAYLQKPPIPNP